MASPDPGAPCVQRFSSQLSPLEPVTASRVWKTGRGPQTEEWEISPDTRPGKQPHNYMDVGQNGRPRGPQMLV